MELDEALREEIECVVSLESQSPVRVQAGSKETYGLVLNSTFFLDCVGEVCVTLNSHGLSWKLTDDSPEVSSCFGIQFSNKGTPEIRFSDIYAVELTSWGAVRFANSGNCLSSSAHEMYRFVVHGFKRSKTEPSRWVLEQYTFGHKDLQSCKTWVEHINNVLALDRGRPKNLLVFVHPLSGKGEGCKIWDNVSPIFSRAGVVTEVIVTERAGHAYDTMLSITDEKLDAYDGVIAVGGDGFFNEIMNGILRTRHKASYPPQPTGFMQCVEKENGVKDQDDASDPLLCSALSIVPKPLQFRTGASTCAAGKSSSFSIPHQWFRFGIIPAGSTDAIVISSTGARDPVTSALHIILGKRRFLDVARIVRWQTTSASRGAPSLHYAASFAGYGFYGDVVKESECYRWMGPARYDYAGTKVFLQHRSYEADVSFVASEPKEAMSGKGSQANGESTSDGPPETDICRVNCPICSEIVKSDQLLLSNDSPQTCAAYENMRWIRRKGRFLSVGAAIISCRNQRAPDGVVANAHLADGLLHLILIKDCPHALYLWHLTRLARRGLDPFDFEFVEHHKTPMFTFVSSGHAGIWNVDGELFQAHQLSAQVFRGLISLFADGPEV